ncbi:prolipoprotein diacylglyceryl transferase [Flavobacterium pallidum]|uniref:Diacylglyceryl transferase n=1 Tax=Flavobacterium pallidum TaxID=2172098 RepID=A0A2S1SKT1_9FLAO|nr:prolipoprotein diacylglyceryl transferase family protein [Flavobacterium pallidum]AWI26947.1 diacylglyceryl transferase [Flavobacterium pallidum]
MKLPFDFPLFQNPGLVHYVFETMAFVVGMQVYYAHRKKITDHISDKNRLLILAGAISGALLGSRLVAVLENPQAIASLTLSEIYQSKTIAGGLAGGLFGVELIKKCIGVNTASGDLYVLPIITAVFIGRIGCFLSGVAEPTFGIETTFFTGMDLGDGVQRHPIALYEMFFLLLLWIVFRKIKNYRIINGDRFKLFMILYFLFRFLVEFLKPFHPLIAGLSSIHLTCLFIYIYYHRFLLRITNLKSHEDQRLRLL